MSSFQIYQQNKYTCDGFGEGKCYNPFVVWEKGYSPISSLIP